MSSSSNHNQIQRYSTRAPHGSTTTDEKIRWSLGKLNITDETIHRNKLVTDHMGRNIGQVQEVVKRRTEVVKYASGKKEKSHHHQHQQPREVVNHKNHDYHHQTREVVKNESREKDKSHHQYRQHYQSSEVVREMYKSHDHRNHHHQSHEVMRYDSREKHNSHHHHQSREVVKYGTREKDKSHNQHQPREVVIKYEAKEKYYPGNYLYLNMQPN